MSILDTVRGILDLGGPVISVLLVMSVLALGVILYKIWQFSASGVGRHRALSEALAAWDSGDHAKA